MVDLGKVYTTDNFPSGVRVLGLHPEPDGSGWDYEHFVGDIRRLLKTWYARELEGPYGSPIGPGDVARKYLVYETDEQRLQDMLHATRTEQAAYYVAQLCSLGEERPEPAIGLLAMGRSSHSIPRSRRWRQIIPGLPASQPNCFVNDIAVGSLDTYVPQAPRAAWKEVGSMVLHAMLGSYADDREVLRHISRGEVLSAAWFRELGFKVIERAEVERFNVCGQKLPQELWGGVSVSQLTQALETQYPSFAEAA